jgi:hypothetical protein
VLHFILTVLLLVFMPNLASESCINDNCCVSKTTFIPLQVTYDPVYEHALNYYKKNIFNKCWKFFFTGNYFFQNSVGNNINTYFNIDNKKTMEVREDGTGDIDSVWFKVISSDDTFYKSNIRMCPERLLFGVNLYFDVNFSWLCSNLRLAVNTSIAYSRNKINFTETNIENQGTVKNFKTVTEAITGSSYEFGRICCQRDKTGLDDIQVKLIKRWMWCNKGLNLFGLIGIPTGEGTKSLYLFEPLVGTKNFNVGVGLDFDWNFYCKNNINLSLLGEFKWRYGIRGKERRSFDLTDNGQWSRYLLLVKESDKNATFPAINELALDANVTQGTNVNGWFAAHINKKCCDFEFGYAVWFRQKEKIQLAKCDEASIKSNLAIADLVGIAAQNPQSASTANISQSVEPGSNQIQGDSSFIALKDDDLNLDSAAHPQVLTNKFYASIGYNICYKGYPAELMLSVSYEKSRDKNALDQVAVWLGSSIMF